MREGGKQKIVNAQMKVLEPKWKGIQRRALQNTMNKYSAFLPDRIFKIEY